MVPPFSCTAGRERVKAGGKVIYEGQLEFKRFKYTSSVPASFGSSHLSVPTEKLDTEFFTGFTVKTEPSRTFSN